MSNFIKKKILFIDHESGHGGSSISLYNKIKLLSQKNYKISVILRKHSHIVGKYKSLKVKVFYLEIPTITSLKKLSSNIISYYKYFFKLTIFICKNQKFFKKINNFDHIHLNHENLFWILKLIRIYNNKIKITMSIRTILERNFFSKIQINVINNEANKKLFITKKNFYEFNYQVNKKKMNNFILENFDLNKQPQNIFLKKKNKSRNLNILSISNFSHDRGVDRIVRIAEKLDIKGFRNIKFNILGDYKINSLKNILKNNSNQNLKYFVQQKQLKNVNILGHKSNTQKYFKKNHLLLYLPRNDSAWGRNIIEALNNGLPVITLGKTNSLIINKKNGYFFYNFKETLIIKIIKEFYYNRNKLTKMSIAAKNISKKKNDKKKISKKLNLFFNY
tara:strand:- start:2016 stop:3188 length:1173 start_codon:yes stop_codon:yes gene_type:complete